LAYVSKIRLNITTLSQNLKPRLHDTTGCQTGWTTGCQTGWTTGWMFVYMM